MIRFWSIRRDPVNGSHPHLLYTSFSRSFAKACEEMRARVASSSGAPLFWDFGPGDSDWHKLDGPAWGQA